MRTLLVFSFCCFSTIVFGQSNLDWLNDHAPTDKITRLQTNKLSSVTGFPRKSLGTHKSSISAEKLACFDIMCQKPFLNSTPTIAAAQAINPGLTWLREFCPQEWQGAAEPNDKEGSGHPFNTSGPASANNQMFAGHWAYKPYTTLTSGITSASGITLTVANAANISSGTNYFVIRPADSWDNAEQVELTKSGSTLTLKSRGYKSVAKEWPAGSIIAQHQLGNGSGNLNWCYNHSTKCPKDANGKKFHEVLAAWLASHYDKDNSGNPHTSAKCDGVLYDSDHYQFTDGGNISTRNADLDNDGQADWGYGTDGVNHWGNGLEQFYADVRAGIDARGHTNAILLGGVAESWGIIPNNGTQLEAAWSQEFDPEGAIVKNYDRIGYYFSALKAQTGHGSISPRVTDTQGKEASALYHGDKVETRNGPVRFSYCMSMLFDGTWFSNQNGFGDSFHYFDEDAVYTNPSENYGKSVLKSNTADILKNRRWLGNALTPYQRIVDESAFALQKNLMPNGNFEGGLGAWSGSNAVVSISNDKKYEGSACLSIEPVVPNPDLQLDGATVTGPSVQLMANQEYSLCFAVYSETPARLIRVRLGTGLAQKVFVTPGWSKHIYTWKQGATTTSAIQFNVGAQLTKVWVDQLYLFAATADIFRRDFENGIIVANASSSTQTIKLNGTFYRIKGNLDPVANNGQIETELTLPAHEGLFLVRPSQINGSQQLKNMPFRSYPNPFDQTFALEIPNGAKNLAIFDLTGKLILNRKIVNQSSIEIKALASCPSGIYVVDVDGLKQKIVKR